MRAFVIATVFAAGIGLAGVSPTLAAPANGTVIGHAAHTGKVVDQVRWYRRHHRHHHFYRYHHRRWWWW